MGPSNESFNKTFYSFSQEFKLKRDFIIILDIVIKKDLHKKFYLKFTLIRYEVANRIKNFLSNQIGKSVLIQYLRHQQKKKKP